MVCIPAVQQVTGVTDGGLGTLLLLLGGAGFAGMQAAGGLADRSVRVP
ncbi:hypothetical protein [Rarobacter incanus]|nr:hypothetical protein [Rarobacter incanus]